MASALSRARERLAARKKALAAAKKAFAAAKAAVATTTRTVKRLEAAQKKPGVWMPGVPRDPASSIGPWTVGEKAGCLHTTEGSTFAGADAALKSARSQPHFLVGPGGEIKQYRPIGDAATTLRNAPGGVETNRKRLVQIEVVGFASKPDWPEAQKQAVARVMAFCARHGVPLVSNVRFTDARGVRRLNGQQWLDARGWLGHQHVPENDHWDPGAVDITDLLNRARQL